MKGTRVASSKFACLQTSDCVLPAAIPKHNDSVISKTYRFYCTRFQIKSIWISSAPGLFQKAMEHLLRGISGVAV